MSDISKGESFHDGETVTGERLNMLVDEAEIQPGIIADRDTVIPAVGDSVLLLHGSGLGKATVAAVNSAGGNVNSVGLVLPPNEFSVSGGGSGNVTLTGAWFDQTVNRVLASPNVSASVSSGRPGFRRLVPEDMRTPTNIIPGTAIDWSLSNSHAKSLVLATTFSFQNHVDGMSIEVALLHNGFVATWPVPMRWPNGVVPAPTAGVSMFRFTNKLGVLYGWLEESNLI